MPWPGPVAHFRSSVYSQALVHNESECCICRHCKTQQGLVSNQDVHIVSGCGQHLDDAGGQDLVPQCRLAGAVQGRQRAPALRGRQVVRLRRGSGDAAETLLPLPWGPDSIGNSEGSAISCSVLAKQTFTPWQ